MVALKHANTSSWQWGLTTITDDYDDLEGLTYRDANGNYVAPYDTPVINISDTTSTTGGVGTGLIVQSEYTDAFDNLQYSQNSQTRYIRYETMINPSTGEFVDYSNDVASGSYRLYELSETVFFAIHDILPTYHNDIYLHGHIPIGFLNTLRIIAHRNTVLQGTTWITTSNEEVNGGIFIPDSGNVSNVTNKIAEIRNFAKTDLGETESKAQAYGQYLYPPASLCYSYVPFISEGQTLSQRFASGRWYLPSIGELARICFYEQGIEQSELYDSRIPRILQKAYNESLYTPATFTGNYLHSSSEYNAFNTWYVGTETNGIRLVSGNKWWTYRARPCCVF